MQETPYIGVREAATLLGVCEETIRRLAKQREIPGMVRIGRQFRFNKGQLLTMGSVVDEVAKVPVSLEPEGGA